MLGMMYELESSGKTDKNFLKNCTSGFEVFRDYLLGKSDGTPKTPEWASDITGIPADKIRALTHELADNRTMIMMGWGIQRIQYGEQPHWMAFTLVSMLGQIGLPGGGVGTNYHYSFRRLPFPYRPDDQRLSISSRTCASEIKALERKCLYSGYAVCGLFPESGKDDRA